MAGELSATVRGLRRKETFNAAAREDDNLNALVGSLDRLEDACDEALAVIGIGGESSTIVDGDSSDWAKHQRLKADYQRRLDQEEAFVASGGEQKRVEPVRQRLSVIGELDRNLSDLEKMQSEIKRHTVPTPKVRAGDVQAGLREIAEMEAKLASLDKEASRLSRIANRIAPAGADMREWTLPKLRAFADELAPHEAEFRETRNWICRAKDQLAKKKEKYRRLESDCKTCESAQKEHVDKLTAFRLLLAKCIQKAKKIADGGLDEQFKNFLKLSTALSESDIQNVDVCSVQRVLETQGEDEVARLKDVLRIDRSVQPSYRDLGLESVNLTSQVPSFLRTGTQNAISNKGCKVEVPVRQIFPLSSVVYYSGQSELAGLLLRLAFGLPQGTLQVKVIDAEAYGASVQSVSRLATLGDLEILSEAADIDSALHDVETYAADLVREGRFSGSVRDWAAYNRENPEDLLPYRVLVLTSCGSLTEDQTASLKRIIRRGREIGVCVVRPKGDGVQFAAEPWVAPGVTGDVLPTGSMIDALIEALEEARRLSQSVEPKAKRSFVDIVSSGQGFWSCSAAESVVAVLGFDEADNSVELKLGGENNHVLLGGTTGSGKSNLIHVMLRSLCMRYSPEELRLYLLDYKDGLEFGKYVECDRAWLPHVESVSVHNDPAYALSMLDYIQRECLNRKRQFAGARNYAEYRHNGGKMPRIFIVIDEFHKLFETADAEMMSARIMQVLKQGRAYGVHLVLATQTLASTDIPNLAGMLGQIPVRLALRGSEDDRILDPDNLAATTIAIPKCVYNDQFGRKKGNCLFNVPEAIFDGSFKREICSALKSSGQPGGMGLVFNGTQMPSISVGEFTKMVRGANSNVLRMVVGEENAFCGEPVALSLEQSPTAHVLIAASAGDGPVDDNGFLYREEVVSAIKDDICRSLEVLQDVEVVCYNPRVNFVCTCKSKKFSICPASASENVLSECLNALAMSTARHRVFVIEDFEHAYSLHPVDAGGYLQSEPSTEDCARSVFLKAFSASSIQMPFHVVLITRNFRYVASNLFYDAGTGLNLLKMFTHRVAVDIPLDDVQTLYPTYLRRDAAGKMLYGSAQSDAVQSFLPYVIKES